MRIEEQVLSIEQAKHLQELGLNMSDACFCWCKGLHNDNNYHFTLNSNMLPEIVGTDSESVIPTYTLQEVWNKLPYKIKTPRYDILQLDFIDYELMYHDKETGYVKHWETGKIIESAYEMLCWVLENGYLKEDNK